MPFTFDLDPKLTARSRPHRGDYSPRILCAVDLSSRSTRAVSRALGLAHELNGRVSLLHVVSDELPLRLTGRRVDRAHSAMYWHMRQLRSLPIKPDVTVRVGPLVPTIVESAMHTGADLVILGPQRRRGSNVLRRLTAERIAQRLRRPVLVTSLDASDDYRSITFLAAHLTSPAAQWAKRLDLFRAAHVSVAPRLPVRARIALAASRRAGAGHLELTRRVRELAHRDATAAIKEARLDAMGFEVLSDIRNWRALLVRIKQNRAPQLLIASTSRNPLQMASLERQTAFHAMSSGACDVLLFPRSAAQHALRSARFAAAVERA
jgi:universal stress protein E